MNPDPHAVQFGLAIGEFGTMLGVACVWAFIDEERPAVPGVTAGIGAFVAALVFPGSMLIALVLGLAWGLGAWGWGLAVRDHADGNPARLLGFSLLMPLAPLFLVRLALEPTHRRQLQAFDDRRAGERIWRAEFRASGASNPDDFTAVDPRAVRPATIAQRLDLGDDAVVRFTGDGRLGQSRASREAREAVARRAARDARRR